MSVFSIRQSSFNLDEPRSSDTKRKSSQLVKFIDEAGGNENG